MKYAHQSQTENVLHAKSEAEANRGSAGSDFLFQGLFLHEKTISRMSDRRAHLVCQVYVFLWQHFFSVCLFLRTTHLPKNNTSYCLNIELFNGIEGKRSNDKRRREGVKQSMHFQISCLFLCSVSVTRSTFV